MSDSKKIGYYSFDETWSIFGIKTKMEYEDKFVLVGRFHKSVHVDIIKTYSTIEHTMALAYFHYPLYDIVLNQLLSLYEMAIKLRCDQVGIERKFITKRGHKREKRLVDLIDELVEKSLLPEIKNVMNNVRKIRNIEFHPDKYSLKGSISMQPMIPIINLLNHLYISKEEHIEAAGQLNQKKELLSKVSNQLFVVQHEGLRILTYNPCVLDVFKVNNDWVSAVFFNPVLNDSKTSATKHRIPTPVIKFIYNLELKKDIIFQVRNSGDIETVAEISLKEKDKESYSDHLAGLIEAEAMDRSIYSSSMLNSAEKIIQKYIFENAWK